MPELVYQRKYCNRKRYRLQQPFSLLYECLWNALHPWPRSSYSQWLKASRPELSVWVVTGDGDSLSIGGNHTIHLLRRNFDINILLFNNQIYGLTKGNIRPLQKNIRLPRARLMAVSIIPSTRWPWQNGADLTFIARSMDRDPKHLQAMLTRSHQHKGASFLEIYQNCNIFNDGAFEIFTEKGSKPNEALFMEQGKPLIFWCKPEQRH